MKRVHINITVTDLDRSVGFYTTLFGTGPTVLKQDYAKWMLEDPRLNLSISTRCGSPGVDHLGIQTESADELDTLAGRLKAAGERHVDQADANCCYARGDKTWVFDPEGVAWETFHTTGAITHYGEDLGPETGSACGHRLTTPVLVLQGVPHVVIQSGIPHRDCDASEAIQAGRLSPVDLVDALLDRIDAHEERLHAFAAVYRDEARAAAEAAHKAIRSGHGVGPWHGVPIALKDIIDLEGRVTTIGSKHWADRISPTTATLARRLIEAGMIVIGKANTVEFAMGGWGTNRHMGTPRNPWDAEVHRAPGGSSSGSGVSVAARLAPWAIGTDTGGSVRIPSAWCGLAGLKVTIGQISAAGVAPLSHTLDTPGPMTRSVEDAARLYMVLQGPIPPIRRRCATCRRIRCPRCGGASLGSGLGSWPRPSGTAWMPTCSPPTTPPWSCSRRPEHGAKHWPCRAPPQNTETAWAS